VIILWGSPKDAPLREVAQALHAQRTPFVIADAEATPPPSIADMPLRRTGGVLRIARQLIDLDTVTGLYVRPQSHASNPVDELLSDWAELRADVAIINSPSAMAANACKPLQLRIIERHGFRVPDTLLTTNIEALQRFRDQHAEVIYKSISGVRSIVSRLQPDRDLSDLRHCPTQFQEYIAGVDYRAHVVDSEIFVCRIESDADDYRYASAELPTLHAASLPSAIAEKIQAMVKAMGLRVSGVDLRQTPEQDWVCFEVNPSPGFSYFAAATGQPIATAIASSLSQS
jgi:glutathione synthase/RimK-type ligase-like ATP-grasp enzyme